MIHGLWTLFSKLQCCQKSCCTSHVSSLFYSQKQLVQTSYYSPQPGLSSSHIRSLSSHHKENLETICMPNHQFLVFFLNVRFAPTSELLHHLNSLLLSLISQISAWLTHFSFLFYLCFVVTFSIRLTLCRIPFHSPHRHTLFTLQVCASKTFAECVLHSNTF